MADKKIQVPSGVFGHETVGYMRDNGEIYVQDGIFHQSTVGKMKSDGIYVQDGIFHESKVLDMGSDGSLRKMDGGIFSKGSYAGRIANDGSLYDDRGWYQGRVTDWDSSGGSHSSASSSSHSSDYGSYGSSSGYGCGYSGGGSGEDVWSGGMKLLAVFLVIGSMTLLAMGLSKVDLPSLGPFAAFSQKEAAEAAPTSLGKLDITVEAKSKPYCGIKVSWSKVKGAQRYCVQVCSDSDFENDVIEDHVRSKTTPGGYQSVFKSGEYRRIKKGSTFYVRARAEGVTDWSDTAMVVIPS